MHRAPVNGSTLTRVQIVQTGLGRLHILKDDKNLGGSGGGSSSKGRTGDGYDQNTIVCMYDSLKE